LIGVYEPGVPKSLSMVNEFATNIGRDPNLVVTYGSWYDPFGVSLAEQVREFGGALLIQLQPIGATLSGIAAGKYDRYLTSYADAVRGFAHPVAISFGHEMNGTWYKWGATHVSPAVFVAAWRHIVTVFRKAGANNVTWVWTINSINAAPRPLKPWWPGNAYVDWVGIDGYFYYSSDTFESVFGSTLAEVRQFTDKPSLVAETGIGPQASQLAQIRELFTGVQDNHMIGLVWFDQGQNKGVYHQDWRLEDTPSALAQFKQEVSELG
jgi:hypothetical protein